MFVLKKQRRCYTEATRPILLQNQKKGPELVWEGKAEQRECFTLIAYLLAELWACFTKHCVGQPRRSDVGDYIVLKRLDGTPYRLASAHFAEFAELFRALLPMQRLEEERGGLVINVSLCDCFA